MSDPSAHPESTVQQPDKPCVVCSEPIKAAAKKCIKCGAYQDWRRHLELTLPWVPWVVALSTAAFAILNYGSRFMHVPDSNIELSSPYIFNDEARFIVANAGDRPGVVEQVSVRFLSKDAAGRSYYFQSTHAIPPEQTDIIKPGEQLQYILLLTERPIGVEFDSDVPGFLKLLRQMNTQMFERNGECRFSVVARNFHSERKHIDTPIRCYDLAPYINNYLFRVEKNRLQDKSGALP